MWDRAVDGRVLRFHLAGLNHQNLLLADEETGSWWQQITGECILGPLKGKRLRRIASDEVSLATWRAERPESRVVKFELRHLNDYEPADWEVRAKMTGPRELVVGIDQDGVSAAYALASLRAQSQLNVQVGRTPILLVVDVDLSGVRSFVRPNVDGKPLEFFGVMAKRFWSIARPAAPGTSPAKLRRARSPAARWNRYKIPRTIGSTGAGIILGPRLVGVGR